MPQQVMPQPTHTANNSTAPASGLSSKERSSDNKAEQFANTLEQQAQQRQQQVYAEQRRSQHARAEQAGAEQRQAQARAEQQAADERAATSSTDKSKNDDQRSNAEASAKTSGPSSDDGKTAPVEAATKDTEQSDETSVKNSNDSDRSTTDKGTVKHADDTSEQPPQAADEAQADIDDTAQQWLALLEAMREQLHPNAEMNDDSSSTLSADDAQQRIEQLLAQLAPELRDAARQLIAANGDSQSLQQLAELTQQLLQIAEQQPEGDAEQWLASLKQQLQAEQGSGLSATQQQQLQQLSYWLTQQSQQAQQTEPTADKPLTPSESGTVADKSVALLRALMQLQQVTQQASQSLSPTLTTATTTTDNADKAPLAEAIERQRQAPASATNSKVDVLTSDDKAAVVTGQQGSSRATQVKPDAQANSDNLNIDAQKDNRSQPANTAREAVIQQLVAQAGQSEKQTDKVSNETPAQSLNGAAAMSAQRDGNSLAQQQQQRVADASTSFAQALRQSQQSLNANDPQAALQLRERVLMMVNQGVQRADIRLDPPELGGLHIRLHVQNDQATVHFQVQHQQSREIVEQALPRLKEMLEQQGLQLADSNVSEQRQQGNDGDAQQQAAAFATQGEPSAGDSEVTHMALNDGQPLGVGRVDFYI